MSAETTPAIERAVEALVSGGGIGGFGAEDENTDAAKRVLGENDATVALAAALDVEEMAQALFAWNTPQNPYFVLQGRPDGSGEDGQDEDPYLPIARAIRTAILGTAS